MRLKTRKRIADKLTDIADVLTKCGGPGGTMGPCPSGGDGGGGGIYDHPTLPKIKGLKWGSPKNTDYQHPLTGEILKAQIIPFRVKEKRGLPSIGGLMVYQDKDGSFGVRDRSNTFGDQGYEKKSDALGYGINALRQAYHLQ